MLCRLSATRSQHFAVTELEVFCANSERVQKARWQVASAVTPVKTGVQEVLKNLLSDFKVRALNQTGRRPAVPLDSGFRRNDGNETYDDSLDTLSDKPKKQQLPVEMRLRFY
jgi:hypothetical protein